MKLKSFIRKAHLFVSSDGELNNVESLVLKQRHSKGDVPQT